jgi:hypothetical protein
MIFEMCVVTLSHVDFFGFLSIFFLSSIESMLDNKLRSDEESGGGER